MGPEPALADQTPPDVPSDISPAVIPWFWERQKELGWGRCWGASLCMLWRDVQADGPSCRARSHLHVVAVNKPSLLDISAHFNAKIAKPKK